MLPHHFRLRKAFTFARLSASLNSLATDWGTPTFFAKAGECAAAAISRF
jgi:hypothetical protein